MPSQFDPTSSTTDGSRSSSPTQDLPDNPPLLRPEDDVSDPSPPTSPKSSLIASPPLDTRAYSPHGVGIGILSPQPVLGPFAPITRANFSPLCVRSSPAEQRSNPLESVPPRTSGSPYEPQPHALRPTGSRSPENSQPSPPVPQPMRHVDDMSRKGWTVTEHMQLPTFLSAGEGGQVGLRISLPPPNPTATNATPSPPLLSQPVHDPIATSLVANLEFESAPQRTNLDTPATAVTVDLLPSEHNPNIEYTEFDTEGCSALEKIYLFSRSRASFHRVFIAHALPQYLLGAEPATADLPSREIIEQITPGDAVRYVLPLLNNLATDEDEAVKEALAAELVPIIWWFITRCRLIEDEPPPPSPPATTPLSSVASLVDENIAILPHLLAPQPDSVIGDQDALLNSGDDGLHMHEHDDSVPIEIPVQTFTPMLGTLLLSPNGIVGGSARYAVVELLRRSHRADEREKTMDDTNNSANPPEQQLSRPVSPTYSQASYQDSAESLDLGLFQQTERRLFEHELIHQVVIGMGRLDIDYHRDDHPMDEFAESTSEWDAATTVPTPQPTMFTTETQSYFPSAINPALTFADTTVSPPPVMSLLSASLMEESPGHSSSSTPSLVSSTSLSSGDYSEMVELSDLDRFGIGLSHMLSTVHHGTSGDGQTSTTPESKTFMAVKQEPDWTTTSASPPASLASSLDVQPPSPVANTVPVSDEQSLVNLPTLVVQSREASPPTEVPPQPHIPSFGWLSPGSAARELAALEEEHMGESADINEEAALGRLCSMSLMAAVTASGSIREDTQRAFVAEVERVGRDSVYWVRREASFAVGALAKVVPVEVVTSSLLPLFESLCHDSTWHVRHSVLFALPAILSRLSSEHRRKLALEVILPLSQDEQPTVRSAVLEALGEVIYTFAGDGDGPPAPLLNLFLGVQQTHESASATSVSGLPTDTTSWDVPSKPLPSATSATSSAWSDYGTESDSGPDIYDDPQRPLICAFNYPAVALSLGSNRWPELRLLYVSLARDPSLKIRKTLAASSGEIAKIIGEEHAAVDLMGVFWSSLHAAEGEVRVKIIAALPTFVRAIARPQRVEVVQGLGEVFASGRLFSWRERELAVKVLAGLVRVDGVDSEVLKSMLVQALDDRVAAVREAAVFVLPTFLKAWKESSPTLVEALVVDIRSFANSGSFRQRTTYAACVQEMLVSDLGDVVVWGQAFWDTLSTLVRDPIVDVRIRVARLLGLISDKLGSDDNINSRIIALSQHLVQDPSHEVQAFANAALTGSHVSQIALHQPGAATTFSRPPPSALS